MRALHRLALVATLIAGIVGSHAQQPPASPQAETPQAFFRTGVDFVSLDVSVLDSRNQPVRGLTAGDFVVLENGKPQSIVAFLPVDVPGPTTVAVSWLRDIGEDVVSNDVGSRRLVVIVLDDAYTGIDEGESTRARAIARAVVDQLGPADLAAVAFSFLGTAQNFTADRSRLLAAIDSFIPRNWTPAGAVLTTPTFGKTPPSGGAGPPLGCMSRRGGCLVDLLKHIGELLETAPGGRKMLMLISTHGSMSIDVDALEQMTPVLEMFRALQQANVSVFAFDPRGLSLGGRPDDLLSVADATGGRAVVNTNEPEAHVAGVFEQNASYYLLGFRSDDSRRNGHFRKLEVRVNRSDVRVRTRSGYFAPRDRRSRHSDVPPIVRTLEHGLPGRGLPIRLNVAAFGIPGRREAAVTLAATLADEGGTPGDGRLELFAAAFDSGWKERGRHRQAMTIRREADGDQRDAELNVLSRLTLRPGRYEVRLAADRGGLTGSAILTVDVPDFHASPLALSGVLLERRSMPIAGDARLLADLVPVTPTAVRAFRRGDHVNAFARVYQGHGPELRPATLAARIVNERDETVWETRTAIGVEAFGSPRAADRLERLPLSDLPAGPYLLTIEAEAGGSRARRDVRFEVR